jgi:peptidoglycan/xylan/chitin deacetylase (PgdA/CDA1 family)
MKKGVFTISLDFELAWGRIEDEELNSFLPLVDNTKDVVKELISLFEEFNIPVTWATVGYLFEKNKWDDPKHLSKEVSKFYSKISYKNLHDNKDFNKEGNSYLQAPGLIKDLMNSSVKHDIGSHSYNHIVFSWDNCTKQIAEEDIKQTVECANEYGLKMNSFVYPRNGIAHKEVLKENGYTNYRGIDKTFYDNYPTFLVKAIRQLEAFYPFTPSTLKATKDTTGLIEIPGSMLFRVPHLGFKSKASVNTLVKRAKKGIDKAIKNKEIFHLWFHPFNFAFKTEEHFNGLKEILEKVAAEQAKGNLEVQTMQDIAEEWH